MSYLSVYKVIIAWQITIENGYNGLLVRTQVVQKVWPLITPMLAQITVFTVSGQSHRSKDALGPLYIYYLSLTHLLHIPQGRSLGVIFACDTIISKSVYMNICRVFSSEKSNLPIIIIKEGCLRNRLVFITYSFDWNGCSKWKHCCNRPNSIDFGSIVTNTYNF